ncbi:hypothetical protein NDU88_008006 [Pleurodeles waltl]|uniref:Uncharacterized protein n=1 Tax=Pleurodeles waltl TaxID=8319 RepID=A0AAV7QTB4_PLEWA|nr:hypothetical protein NDU88_008006 [Pleurodeles waltl]
MPGRTLSAAATINHLQLLSLHLAASPWTRQTFRRTLRAPHLRSMIPTRDPLSTLCRFFALHHSFVLRGSFGRHNRALHLSRLHDHRNLGYFSAGTTGHNRAAGHSRDLHLNRLWFAQPTYPRDLGFCFRFPKGLLPVFSRMFSSPLLSGTRFHRPGTCPNKNPSNTSIVPLFSLASYGDFMGSTANRFAL